MLRMFNRRNWIVYDDDKGSGGPIAAMGGEATTEAAAQPAQQPAGKDPRQGYERLVDRHGGADPTAWLLYQENHGYRNEIRDLKAQLEALQKQVPAQDAVVLSGTKAEQWNSYQKLGKAEDLATMQQEYQTLSRRLLVNDAANAAGFKPAVLDRLITDALQVEIRTEGEKATAYVKEGEGEAVALQEYAKANWHDFLPSLTAEQQQRKAPPNIDAPAGGAGGTAGPSTEQLRARYGV